MHNVLNNSAKTPLRVVAVAPSTEGSFNGFRDFLNAREVAIVRGMPT